MAAAKRAPAVKVHEEGAPTQSPSEQLIRDSLAEVEVTDDRGRIIVFGKPPILQQSRFIRMLNPDDAKNQAFIMTYFIPATWVKSIDGDPILPPSSMREVEANIQRLDEAGITAILKKIEELGLAAQSEEEAKAAVKK